VIILIKKTLLIVNVLMLVGCASSTPLQANKQTSLKTNTQIKVVNQQALKDDKNIQLPNNYDVDSFGIVRVVAYVESLNYKSEYGQSSTLDKGIASKLLENELARTKRFKILTRSCGSCDYEAAYQLENTLDEQQITMGEALNPDFVLETSIDLGLSIKELYDHNEAIFYSVATTKLVNPTTKEIIQSFAPVRQNLLAKNYTQVSGHFLNGFKIHDEKERYLAFKDAAQQAIQVLVSQVMNYYPVGGRLTNFRTGSSRFAIDAGIEQGFAVKQPVILFISDDGLDIPIASAEVTPKRSGGSGMIIKWRDDADATAVKKKLEALGKDYLQSVKVYAVSIGTPQSWQF
jgi:hypothetical protein